MRHGRRNKATCKTKRRQTAKQNNYRKGHFKKRRLGSVIHRQCHCSYDPIDLPRTVAYSSSVPIIISDMPS